MSIESNEYRAQLVKEGTIHSEDNYRKFNVKRLFTPLKKHQELALYNMKMIEDGDISISQTVVFNTNVGVYSDCVGAGKSYTLLALMDLNNKPLRMERTDVFMNGNVTLKTTMTNLPNLTTLLVVPHSIVKQWETYIKENTNFTYYKINNNKSRESFKQNETTDIILISSSMYNDFIFDNNHILFNRVIFDEADSINIPNCEKPNANFVWMVTSSLQNLLFVHGYYYVRSTTYNDGTGIPVPGRNFRRHNVNGIKKNGFIKDTFKHISPYYSDPILKHIIVKNNDEFIQRCFELTDPENFIVKCKSPAYLNIVREVVSRDVLDRLNAGDKEGALSVMGCNVDTFNNVVENVTKELKMKLNNTISHRAYIQGLEFTQVSAKLQQKKKLESLDEEITDQKNKIKSIEERLSELTSSTCPICIETLEDPIACLGCCKNLFCLICITNCVTHKPTCPMCREIVDADSINVIYNKKIKLTQNELPSKEDALLKLLRKKDRKFLVFSSYDNTFKNLEKTLITSNIKYSKILGNSNSIQSNLNKYKNGDLDVLLLNSQNYGSGINLQNTTDIIFFHKMSKDIETQVIGRAQRYGRTQNLRVHFLFYEHEI